MATIYICKCGRQVRKSTNADNTGNRDTENCKGCPYLLPWGPTQWDATRHAMVTDVKGYECRMSPSLDYATYYQGGGEDKCVLHIYSLDYDFLDRVTAWAAKQFPDKEISCSFDRSKIRATEFIGGLYGMSVYPMQNKKGMAAKAALIERFFGPDGHRLDTTPEEEKAIVLAAIEAGKAKASGKEKDMQVYTNQYGTLFAVREHNGSPALMCKAKESEQWVMSGVLAAVKDDAKTIGELQAVLDKAAQKYNWEPVENVPVENPTNAAEDVQQCAPTASDVLLSQSQSVNADAQQGGGDDSENPTYSAVATAAAEETAATPEPLDLASMTVAPVAKTSAATTGADENILVGSGGLTAFDFSALGDLAEQAAEADEQFNLHYGRAQDEYLVSCIYLARIHELTAKAGRYGGGTWTAWYQSKGISEGSARTMVQNGDGFKSASVADLKNLPVLTKKDLNLIARNGVANQVVEAAGEGDSDRIQDILNQLKAVQTERDEARKAKEKAEQERDAARDAQANLSAMANKFSKQRDAAEQRIEDAEHRAEEAERRARAAEEDAAGWKQAGLEMQELVDQRDERIRELESGITVEAAAVDQEEIERRANELSEPLLKIINQRDEQIKQMASGNTVSAQASVLEQYLRTMQTSLLSNAQRAELAFYDVGALDSLARALREFADSIDEIFEDRSEDND
ncbi:coiled-coil domain-containing protein [Allofournierella massiliensis]|uniref:Uncharacterized protein n=1 Tax=Allofournierella massiliensis TaxID=1650663 RepID=A0A4R1QV26_9FIRM|nr:hypothetical protein [Fournierella massiliensis]TCL56415.1 hypothetical protein EDD77_11381 [Fournierella massiliensis]